MKPRRFFDPGLFVTSDATQWRGFLTQQGIDTGVPALQPKQVNVPSMADGSVTSQTTFRRTFRATRAGVWSITADVPGFKLKTSPAKVRSERRGDLVDVKFTFTRKDAKLNRYAQGAVTLSGPTSVRLPVALKPVSVAAPVSVSGTGRQRVRDRHRDGRLHRLARRHASRPRQVRHGRRRRVAPKAESYQCVTVTPGTSLAKFQVDVHDNTADLDLVVLAAESCDPESAFALAGQSGTASGDEAVTLRNPPAGVYIAEVSGFSAGEAGSPMAFDFDFWDLDASATAGSLAVTPDPVPVQVEPEGVGAGRRGAASTRRPSTSATWPTRTRRTSPSWT